MLILNLLQAKSLPLLHQGLQNIPFSMPLSFSGLIHTLFGLSQSDK